MIFTSPTLNTPTKIQYNMKQKKFDFSKPTGIVSLVLLVLSFVAYAIGLILSIQGVNATNAGNYWAAADWNYAAMYTYGGASIGLFIALVFLYLNSRQTKKQNIPGWVVFKQNSAQVLPPLCQHCNYPARWAIEFDSWYCDKCNFIAC